MGEPVSSDCTGSKASGLLEPGDLLRILGVHAATVVVVGSVGRLTASVRQCTAVSTPMGTKIRNALPESASAVWNTAGSLLMRATKRPSRT